MKRSVRFFTSGGTRFSSLSSPYFSVMAVMAPPAMMAVSFSAGSAMSLAVLSAITSAPCASRVGAVSVPAVSKCVAICPPIWPIPPATSVPSVWRSCGGFIQSPAALRLCPVLLSDWNGSSAVGSYQKASATRSPKAARTGRSMARAPTSNRVLAPDSVRPMASPTTPPPRAPA